MLIYKKNQCLNLVRYFKPFPKSFNNDQHNLRLEGLSEEISDICTKEKVMTKKTFKKLHRQKKKHSY